MNFKRLILVALLLPYAASAAYFESNLSTGFGGSGEIKKLQTFLVNQGLYSGPVTGGYFNLTKGAVKKFQQREHLPVTGNFGPLTRARANQIIAGAPTSQENMIARLREQIQKLQAQLQALQQSQSAPATTTSSSTPTGALSPLPSSQSLLPTAPVLPVVQISGTATSSFPNITTTVLKFGEITVQNNTPQDILFANIETIISDAMDSYQNRNHKVTFLLRNGPSTFDDVVSKVDFTFVSAPPAIGSPYGAPLVIPFGVRLAVGQTKTFSLWVEQLLYVQSGTLDIQFVRLNATTPITTSGTFDLVLTKAPSL